MLLTLLGLLLPRLRRMPLLLLLPLLPLFALVGGAVACGDRLLRRSRRPRPRRAAGSRPAAEALACEQPGAGPHCGGALAAVARTSYRRRRWVLAVWALVLA